MKKYFIFILLILGGKFIYSQTEIDKLMTERAPNCEDIAYNCTRLIEKYFVENKHDSVKVILDYWENKCGLTEPIFRIKILTSIRDNSFTESIYDSTVYSYINKFEDKIDCKQPSETYSYYIGYFGFVLINGSFDKFSMALAKELIKNQKEGTIQYLFCKLYSGDPDYLYTEIQNPKKYNETKLKEYYYKLINKYVNQAEFHWSVSSGIWIPFDNASLLGNHPLLGFEFGSKYRKMNFNASIQFKFINSANKYTVIVDDSSRITNHFFGGYIGLDCEREIFKIRRNEFNVIGGIAWDGFGVLDKNINDDRTDNNDGKSINSLNLNVGLGFRYMFKNDAYIGIKGRFNFVHYNNTGGTDLSGNTMTIAFVYGGFLNNVKNYYLKLYKYRE